MHNPVEWGRCKTLSRGGRKPACSPVRNCHHFDADLVYDLDDNDVNLYFDNGGRGDDLKGGVGAAHDLEDDLDDDHDNDNVHDDDLYDDLKGGVGAAHVPLGGRTTPFYLEIVWIIISINIWIIS